MVGILTWCFADTVFNIRSSDSAADFMLSGFVETTKLQIDTLSGRPMHFIHNGEFLRAIIINLKVSKS